MTLSEMLRWHAVDESGRSAGHVFEVTGRRRGKELVVTGFVLGEGGLRRRLGLGGGGREITMQDIVRIDGTTVVIRDEDIPSAS